MLEQVLPGYGAARFLARDAEAVSLELTAHRDHFAPGPIAVDQVAPPWHDAHPERMRLGEVTHVGGGPAVGGDPLASRLLTGLRRGYGAELAGRDRFDPDAAFSVDLSPLGFRAAYQSFAACLRGVLSLSWAAVERSRVFYRDAEWALPEAALARLELLAAFVRADPTVTRVYVDGHTDDNGGTADNLRLSKRRAEAVADFLEAAGVPGERLVVRYHGERYAVA